MMRSYYLLACLLLAACSSSNEKIIYYFDVNILIDQEIQRLNELHPRVTKTVELNGEREERETSDIDWKKELSVFREADINKAAWRNKYQTDTVFINRSQGQFSQIDYTAMDEDLKCQHLSLYFLRNTSAAYKLEARLHRKNFLYEISQDIGITVGESYYINSLQKVIFLDQRQFDVRAEFVR